MPAQVLWIQFWHDPSQKVLSWLLSWSVSLQTVAGFFFFSEQWIISMLIIHILYHHSLYTLHQNRTNEYQWGRKLPKYFHEVAKKRYIPKLESISRAFGVYTADILFNHSLMWLKYCLNYDLFNVHNNIYTVLTTIKKYFNIFYFYQKHKKS